ncbi:undecaprenyl-diphosphate phosphatase [Candidatus Sumerlaeota bacterium]|nr:undecaprenyl-diphosphate phosphatase [Candidatus Sumerlaeota bacterium]
MTIFQGLLLSLLQGVTEFLPVSSSGHLVLAQTLWPGRLSAADNVVFVVLVHVATLVSVCIVFRERLVVLIAFLFRDGWRPSEGTGLGATWMSDARGRMILAVILGTLPTVVIGLGAKDFFEGLFERPDRTGYALCFTALLLAATFLRRGAGRTSEAPASNEPDVFPFWMAFVIGIAQGLAITPGVSRSGATIAVAILIGMNRRTAGEFSFLLAIPAIVGALILEMKDFDLAASALPLATGAIAFVVAAVSGYVSLRVLLRFVRGGKIGWFSIYCLIVGIWAIARFN